MRKAVLFTCLIFSSLSAMADILTCDALKARVDAKLQAKGIPSYTLEIEPIEIPKIINDASSGISATKSNKGKEVGTCDGGTKRLIYSKGI